MEVEESLPNTFLLEGNQVATVEPVQWTILVCLLLDHGEEFPSITLK